VPGATCSQACTRLRDQHSSKTPRRRRISACPCFRPRRSHVWPSFYALLGGSRLALSHLQLLIARLLACRTLLNFRDPAY
ncbi:unnamed protein product, partial [Oikopleura dioica]